MKELQEDLSQFISLAGETELQLAVYKGDGGRYERHRDAFPTDDPNDQEQRRVTAVLYLTDHHAKGSGGDIKLFRPLGSQSVVETRQGRLLLFLSGVVDHEVLPVSADRAAISAWMR
ncbi:hypothetical protein DFJ73DRAFT_858752 [Zopfochytrium polystomum]|nr:hypothetical protein DFJ73DRAFT_858752 [Zopfochytrium polystomum]